MGIYRLGPPEDIVLFLKQKLNIENFVETGTFYGGTAIWASHHFSHVNTIELSKNLFTKVKLNNDRYKNINFILGDSRNELKLVCTQLNGPAIFWLDAHYSTPDTAGEGEIVPLIEEIRVINQYPYAKNSCILIDDARLFLAPPPKPHPIESFVDYSTILSELTINFNRDVVVFEDVIIAAPDDLRRQFREQIQRSATLSWEEYAQNINRNDFHKSFLFFFEGLKKLARKVLLIIIL